MVNRFAIRSSRWNEIIITGLKGGAFWSHIWNVGELVERRDDAATEISNFGEGVNFPASVGGDERLPDPHVGC